jgi:hypothetical protein
MLVSHYGKIVKMSEEDVKKSLMETEKRLRTGGFQYVKMPMQPKVNSLKGSWTSEAQAFVKTSAHSIANGGNISEDVVQKAIIETCKNHVAPIRAKKNGTDADHEFVYMAGEIALSSLFNVAPDTSLESTPKTYGSGTKKVLVKASSNPKRLVVDEDRAEEAEIYVQAILIKSLEIAMLIGWATKADVLSSSKGNKATNPECNWSRTAYYMPLERLRPMSEFMRDHGLKEVPNGVAFEKLPQLSDIPIMTSPESQFMLISGAPKKEESFDDFLKSSGIEAQTGGVTL